MLENLKRKLLNRKIDMLKDKITIDGKNATTKYNIKAFRITNGQVENIKADIYNDAFNSTNKRVYLKKLPICNPKALINYLKELSDVINTIQIEFECYNNQYNMEIELYFNDDVEINKSFLEFTDEIKAVKIGEYFYNELMN